MKAGGSLALRETRARALTFAALGLVGIAAVDIGYFIDLPNESGGAFLPFGGLISALVLASGLDRLICIHTRWRDARSVSLVARRGLCLSLGFAVWIGSMGVAGMVKGYLGATGRA